MLYFAIISSSFRKSSLDEIKKKADFKIISEFNNYLIIQSKTTGLHQKMKNAIFTNTLVPLSASVKIKKGKYLDSILSAVKASKPSKKLAFKMECIDINGREGYSAKDIEVKTGLKMEKLGYNINITDPEVLGYVVLFNGICYSGRLNLKDIQREFINPYRYYHTKKSVSRSELKLRQAFDEFGISGDGIAIDLGAAPGGWSGFLANKGYKVIAIDKGDLDIPSLKKIGATVSRGTGKGQVNMQKAMHYNIIHIKEGSQTAYKRIKLKDASLLADDMNVDIRITAGEVKRYAKFLKKNADVVLTVKCITKNAPRYIKQAKILLSGVILIKRIKVLPNNRQEFTVYGRTR